MSCMARMRSGVGSLETFPTLLTMDGGTSIFCWEKYWQRSAKRVLSSANSFCPGGNEFSRCSYSLRSSSRPDSPPGSNLSSAPDFGFDRFSFSSLDISLGTPSLISGCRATPLLDCGSSVAPLGAAGLTRLADGEVVLTHPGIGQAVAPGN